MRGLLALSLLLLPTMAMANHPKPPFPEGMQIVYQANCADGETGESGYCIYFDDATGMRWLAFYQRDELAMVRQITGPDSYVTLWRADWYNTL